MATTWNLAGTGPISVVSTQTTTESAPSDPDDGMSLDEVAGFVVTMSCDATKTFNDAASTFLCYRYSETTGRWARDSEHDITVGTANTGARDFATSFMVTTPRGRVAHIANAIGVTGGDLTLTYEAVRLSGKAG